MAVPAAAVIVPVGVLFLLSGLIVNLIQATCYVAIRPFLKSTYRRINRVLAELLWLQLVWLVDWWAGVEMVCLTPYTRLDLRGVILEMIILTNNDEPDSLEARTRGKVGGQRGRRETRGREISA